ncbi:MAG: NCS2 family permease [Candidatus Methylomirabilales bacterium]
MEERVLERWFKLTEVGTDVKTEVIAGVTTFMTMAYIIVVQPTVLMAAGMDFGAVLVATCLSSALATILMAFFANYPIALAPAMGHNFFFTYTVVLGMDVSWQTALGAVFISGSLFIFLSFFGLREAVIHVVPESLKHAIAVGIGLLIALVGLQWSGIVVDAPGTLVGLGHLKSPPVLLALFGLGIMSILLVLGVKGAILWGIGASTLVGLVSGLVQYHGVVSLPPSLAPTLLQLDIAGAFDLGLVTVIFVFLLLDLFDTVGTLIGVSQQAGLLKDGRLPRARGALLADAFGTVGGALLGTSTVTSYVESAAGVAAGGRSGLANLVTAALFLVSLFFYPLVRMVGGGYQAGGELVLYPVTAPALVVVGSIMVRNVRHIPWEEYTEAIPAFLTMIIMPLTFSITEGIAFGFIAFTFLKIVRGQWREVPWLLYLFAALFILRYAALAS